MLCSSSGYPYAMESYSGRKNESPGMPLGEDGDTQLLSKITDPTKESRGAMDYSRDGYVFICCWNDTAIVTVASNHQMHEPVSYIKRYSKLTKKKIHVTQPALI
ncbi:hypothetical protein NPIL_133291 [Nephila pilipes]|uniref:Uncharacterized protein n=1 Tax=Nephila pilipes TaxID=299642 RepID=A0A8X6QDA9_NEPPI|nr:hypothetical protein NPIL_133291 [Nephila pilipes]